MYEIKMLGWFLQNVNIKLIFKNMSKQQILCFKIAIKSPRQISQLKRRQQTHIVGTPKIVLGKFLQDIQQIWTEEYKCLKALQLRELHSNDMAFDIALLIVNVTNQLRKVYGNFILNQNMVFMTKSNKTRIWINSNVFANTPKIYLPQTKQGQICMIKALVNYFKLWLQTHYSTLTEIKTLEQLSFKIQQLRKYKPPVLSKEISLAGFSLSSSKDSTQKFRLYQSTKGLSLKKFTIEPYSKQNSKNSDSSSNREKCFTNRCLISQPMGERHLKKRLTSYNLQTSQKSVVQSGSQGQKSSFTNSFTMQASKSFRSINLHIQQPQQKFHNKTTSCTLKILQKIKLQDQNPDQYIVNKILIQCQQKVTQQYCNKNKLTSQLGGINEQLDNLFMSNAESEENQQEKRIRHREFEEILDI